jgi:hypothetical protein
MNESTTTIVYDQFIGFRAPNDLNSRLERFSTRLGRRKSDTIRYLLINCLRSYENDEGAIRSMREQLY